jgi:uncharacterized protein YfdQ (DUF2303 family)
VKSLITVQTEKTEGKEAKVDVEVLAGRQFINLEQQQQKPEYSHRACKIIVSVVKMKCGTKLTAQRQYQTCPVG